MNERMNVLMILFLCLRQNRYNLRQRTHNLIVLHWDEDKFFCPNPLFKNILNWSKVYRRPSIYFGTNLSPVYYIYCYYLLWAWWHIGRVDACRPACLVRILF